MLESQRVAAINKAMAKANNANKATASTNNSGTSIAAKKAATGTGYVAGSYKSLGPQSQNVTILVGQPGDKIKVTTPTVAYVTGDKTGANTPTAFITPLQYSYTTRQTKSSVSSDAEKVKFGAANGYTDCTCFFADIKAANNFYDQCYLRFNSSPNVHLASTKADPNGYFEVDTEFGPCLIKASKLNEEIMMDTQKDTIELTEKKEETKQKVEPRKIVPTNYIGDDIDAYMEGYMASRDN